MKKRSIFSEICSFVPACVLRSKSLAARLFVQLALLALLAPVMPAIAQGPPPGMGGGFGGPSIDMKRFDADKELARLTKKYKLTDPQKTQIRPVLAEQQKQVHDLGDDTSLSDREYVAAVRAVHRETVTKVKAQMTDEQASKYVKDEEKQAKSDAEDDAMPYGPPGGGGPPPGVGPPPGGGGPPPGA